MKFELLESKGSEGAGFAMCQVFANPKSLASGICACCTCQSGGQC